MNRLQAMRQLRATGVLQTFHCTPDSCFFKIKVSLATSTHITATFKMIGFEEDMIRITPKQLLGYIRSNFVRN